MRNPIEWKETGNKKEVQDDFSLYVLFKPVLKIIS